jgi:hypothetical protein
MTHDAVAAKLDIIRQNLERLAQLPQGSFAESRAARARAIQLSQTGTLDRSDADRGRPVGAYSAGGGASVGGVTAAPFVTTAPFVAGAGPSLRASFSIWPSRLRLWTKS